jgi:amino acid transporter
MDQSTTLEKSLTYPVSLLIYVASVIGTAIFFAPTLGAIESGVYSLIAWIITGVIAIFVAMCFAELASILLAGEFMSFPSKRWVELRLFLLVGLRY